MLDDATDTQAALEALSRTAESHGGRYKEPEAYKGSIARTMFDAPNAEDDAITALIAEENIPAITRGSMVRIASYDRKTDHVEAN